MFVCVPLFWYFGLLSFVRGLFCFSNMIDVDVMLSSGLLTATVASRIHRAAQPALLYLVPFTLLPLLTMAYLKVQQQHDTVTYLQRSRYKVQLWMFSAEFSSLLNIFTVLCNKCTRDKYNSWKPPAVFNSAALHLC